MRQRMSEEEQRIRHRIATKKWNDKNLEQNRARSRKWYSENKDRVSERVKATHIEHPDVRRDGFYRRRFGITLTEYETMLQAQGGCCAICGDSPMRLHVDHCHTTGRVRALLCNTCNSGMGGLKDSPDLLRKAAAYIEAHK